MSDGKDGPQRDGAGAPGEPPPAGVPGDSLPADTAAAAGRSAAPGSAAPGSAAAVSAQGIATTIAEVSERATLLIHEEIELAKAEVAEKVSKLLRGAAVGIAAGIFFVTALFFVLIGCAWLLYYYLPIGSDFTYFWGFFAMALILLVLGVIAGVVAAKVVRRASPPTPNMAIEEARRIRETVSSGAELSEGGES